MRREERSGIAILEEAVMLARRAPARAWTWYLAGAIPFFAALLFFVQATSTVLAVPDLGGPSMLLAVLFGWRQVSRSIFGQVLEEELGERKPERRLMARAVVRTWLGGLLRVLVPLPVPSLTVLFRNYQAYAWTEEHALQQAILMTPRGGNALVPWLALGAISLVVWVNVFTGMLAMPLLYRVFTGEQSVLTQSSGAVFNTTVGLASLITAWCLCDVVMEAMYVLRRFYGESESTGADLLQAWRKGLLKAGGLAVIAVTMTASLRGAVPHTAEPAKQQELNQAVDRVLTGRQYQWREAPSSQSGRQPAVFGWARSVVASIKAFFRPLQRLWDGFWRWLQERDSGASKKGAGPPVSGLRLASVIGIVLLAGALAAMLIRTRSSRTPGSTVAGPALPMPIDLLDPDVVATDLPEEQWIALARDWTAKGDSRMALRAWFLGCLAFLNARELVSISRYKSNLDYRRELARRARGVAGLEGEFAERVRSFECAWYGLYPLDDVEVERFAAGFERMRGLCR